MIFGIGDRYDSVMRMLCEIGLASFDTVPVLWRFETCLTRVIMLQLQPLVQCTEYIDLFSSYYDTFYHDTSFFHAFYLCYILHVQFLLHICVYYSFDVLFMGTVARIKVID